MAAEVTTPARVVDDARLLMRTVRDEVAAGRRPYASDIRRLVERALALRFQAYVQFLERYGFLNLDRKADLLTLTKAGEAAAAGRESQLAGMADDARYHFGDQLVDAPVTHRPSAGVRLDTRYLRLESIGRGGLGRVWRGRLLSVDRPVAIKMLEAIDEVFRPDQREAVVRRFEKAVRDHARLVSPHIVQIIDQNPNHNPPYFVMELAPGGNLKGLLEAGPLPPPVALRYFIQIALGLQAAHAEGVVHRDLKPENVLLDRTGNVKLSDFGLTRVAERDGATVRRAYVGYGSLGYMAPELFRGGEEATPAADVYALGILLYEMLVGDLPGRRSPLPSDVIEGLPEAVDDIFDRMARDDLDGRMSTMAEALDAVFGSEAIRALLDVRGAPGFLEPPRPLPGLPEGEMPEEQPSAAPQARTSTTSHPPRDLGADGPDRDHIRAEGRAHRPDSRAPSERRPASSGADPRDDEPAPARDAMPEAQPVGVDTEARATADLDADDFDPPGARPPLDEPGADERADGAPSEPPAPVGAQAADDARGDDGRADPADDFDSLDGDFGDEPTGALRLSELHPPTAPPAGAEPVNEADDEPAPPAAAQAAEADDPWSEAARPSTDPVDEPPPAAVAEAHGPAPAVDPDADTDIPPLDASGGDPAEHADEPTPAPGALREPEPTPRPRQGPAPRASISISPRAHAPRPRASIARGSTGPYPSAIRDRASQARIDPDLMQRGPTPPAAADPDRTAALKPILIDPSPSEPAINRVGDSRVGAHDVMHDIPLPDSVDEPLEELDALLDEPEPLEEAEILQSVDFEPLDVPASAYDALPSAEPRPVPRVISSAPDPIAEAEPTDEPTYKVSMATSALSLDEVEILDDLDGVAPGDQTAAHVRKAGRSAEDLGAGIEARLQRLRNQK